MGARNVAACYAMWGSLPHGAFRLLAGMALQSLDEDTKQGRPARVWFGGEATLIEMIGGSRPTAYRALNALKEAGAVVCLEPGRFSHRAVYKLMLDPLEDQ